MKELSALKPMKYGTAMFMRNEDERLSELCALLSKDQDCIAIKNEIKRLGAGFDCSITPMTGYAQRAFEETKFGIDAQSFLQWR
ncbi:MAG: hypothetical protein R3D26_20820 [Cyanobacteriota/Melainabacteria group bacterium]